MIQQICSDIYRIAVVLPQNPLKYLNSYVIIGKERNLIIDTGFNRPECLEALQEGLAELHIDMHRTDIFVTHLHADHSGLAASIKQPESAIYMSSVDKELLNTTLQSREFFWKAIEEIFFREGYPREELDKARIHNPARKFVSGQNFSCNLLFDGDTVLAGDRKLECILTPGHTPGHMCLYDRNEKIMFTGDHLLFDITPNITTWQSMPEALDKYMGSLKKIRDYDVRLTLTGHRENNGDFRQRILGLLQHHQERLADIKKIIVENPGINGYHVASKMKWSIRANGWEDFPPGQKWFAVGEAIAHLNYLTDKGEIDRIDQDGIRTYWI